MTSYKYLALSLILGLSYTPEALATSSNLEEEAPAAITAPQRPETFEGILSEITGLTRNETVVRKPEHFYLAQMHTLCESKASAIEEKSLKTHPLDFIFDAFKEFFSPPHFHEDEINETIEWLSHRTSDEIAAIITSLPNYIIASKYLIKKQVTMLDLFKITTQENPDINIEIIVQLCWQADTYNIAQDIERSLLSSYLAHTDEQIVKNHRVVKDKKPAQNAANETLLTTTLRRISGFADLKCEGKLYFESNLISDSIVSYALRMADPAVQLRGIAEVYKETFAPGPLIPEAELIKLRGATLSLSDDTWKRIFKNLPSIVFTYSLVAGKGINFRELLFLNQEELETVKQIVYQANMYTISCQHEGVLMTRINQWPKLMRQKLLMYASDTDLKLKPTETQRIVWMRRTFNDTAGFTIAKILELSVLYKDLISEHYFSPEALNSETDLTLLEERKRRLPLDQAIQKGDDNILDADIVAWMQEYFDVSSLTWSQTVKFWDKNKQTYLRLIKTGAQAATQDKGKAEEN
jgi:hypothetical protein